MDHSEYCSICFAPLILEGGTLLCTACGAQSQSYEDESQEFETGIDDTRFRRTLRFNVKREQSQHRDEDLPPLASLAAAYCSCLQYTLQQACTALQKDFKLSESLQAVARRVWLNLLGHTGVLEEAFSREGAFVQADEPAATGHKSVYHMFRTVLRKVLPPDSCLVVLYMACLLLREPITTVDIVSWALNGRLPFLKLVNAAVEKQLADGNVAFADLVHRLGVMSAAQLLQEAARLSEELQITLPAVNQGSLLQRYCIDMAIPLVLVPNAIALLKLRPDLEPFLSLQANVDPYSILMAALLASAKVHLQSTAAAVTVDKQQRQGRKPQSTLHGNRNGLRLTSSGGTAAFLRQLGIIAANVFSNSKAPKGIEERLFVHPVWDPPPPCTSTDPILSAAPNDGTKSVKSASHERSAAAWESMYASLLMECASYIWMQPAVLHRLTNEFVKVVKP